MRTFANLFLVLFLADGSLSILDEIVTLIWPTPDLTMLRAMLANAVLYLAFPLYLCLGLDRRLPKKLFLPLILFLFWCPLSVWIFPPLADSRVYGLLMAVLQVALGTFLISRTVKHVAPQALTLPQTFFEGPFFSGRNTLVFFGINLPLLPVVLATLLLYTADSYATFNTAGFVRVSPGGVYMMERVYKKDAKTVRLAGMIHVGEKKYYEEVSRLPVAGRAIVLAEGVTDEEGRLKNRFDYGKVASLLGLTPQDKMLFEGRVIEAEALDDPPAEGKQEKPDILRADVDLSTFRPETMLFLDQVGKHLRGNASVLEGMVELNEWAGENVTPAMYEVIMDDILHKRNKVLIAHLDRALPRYDTVVVPWGALHMKEIEAALLERGFKVEEEKKRLSVDLKRIVSQGAKPATAR